MEKSITIEIDATSTEGIVHQMQKAIGGSISQRWGEYSLTVNNAMATGSMRFITFDWGVSLLEYDITFHKEVIVVTDASEYNPIQFIYCLEGHRGHRFGYQDKNEIETLNQFQSVIISSKEGGYNYGYFPKSTKLAINIIQITRKKFLKKRLNGVEALNKRLYEVFM
ncbi:MAG: AraC family transcriptional regulator, partial [Pricia sp.]|nr:AraC family transcriptional regulator [Pricia sp.]